MLAKKDTQEYIIIDIAVPNDRWVLMKENYELCWT